ncbi:MAG: hypothetical protein RLZZ01_2223, partial [Actinomycetota bacterium]
DVVGSVGTVGASISGLKQGKDRATHGNGRS